MRFNLDGLDVFFPYDYLYKEQYDYMLHLKRSLDDKGHVLLEMPTGTGKTVCLLSLITSYQFQHKQTGKLIYCTRTVPEMTKCMEEIKKVIAYRESCIGPEGGKVLALCLSSRRNMCVHPRVLEEGDRDTVDTECRKMTASWVRNRILGTRGSGSRPGHVTIEVESDPAEPASSSGNGNSNGHENNPGHEDFGTYHHTLCDFYENYFSEGSNAEVPQGIYSLDDLREFGTQKGWCPYFMTRHLLHHASILVYNYQYMLDPKVANIVSRELEAESIVVFDEAHNIDNVCIEALSVTLDKRMLDSAQRSVQTLSAKVSRLKSSDSERLQKEYQDLVRGLTEQRQRTQGTLTAAATSSSASAPAAAPSSSSSSSAVVVPTMPAPNAAAPTVQQALAQAADTWLANPVLSRDILEEAVPGNIRKAEHFVSFLRKLVTHLRHKCSEATDVENQTPLAFLHHLQTSTGLERKALKFTYLRLNLLLRTLEITSLDDFTALQDVSNFITLVATYMEGFAVIMEPQGSIVAGVSEPLLQLTCLDAAIAIQPVFERFQSVVITSGTLSPIDLYPRLLNFKPVARVSLPMSTFRPCLLPLIVARGNDQTPLSTRFETRKDTSVLRNYGQLLLDVVRSVPDGVCGFFTSYQYMEYVLQEWDKMHILTQIMAHKLIYLETKDVVETTFALDNYRRACDCGRGAVFLSVARGKVAEGIDFDRHYGRCVILFGIPYQYTLSHTLRARLSFLREKHSIPDNDFLTFDALRQSAQCVGRVIRSKTDYGIVLLADGRYGRADKRTRFPPWIQQFLRDSGVNVSTETALDLIKNFLRQLGQPIDQEALRSILLNGQQVARLQQQDYTIQPPKPVTQTDAEENGSTKLVIKLERKGASSQVVTIDAEEEEEMFDAEAAEVAMEMDHEGDLDSAVNKSVKTEEGVSLRPIHTLAAQYANIFRTLASSRPITDTDKEDAPQDGHDGSIKTVFPLDLLAASLTYASTKPTADNKNNKTALKALLSGSFAQLDAYVARMADAGTVDKSGSMEVDV